MCDNECVSKGKCEHNEECYDDVKYEFGCEVTKIEECPLNREIREDERIKTIEEFARRLKLKFVELPLYDFIVLDILKEIKEVAKQMKGERNDTQK